MLLVAISLIMLLPVIQSCQSNKQIEYKTVYLYPTLDFPQFPKIKDAIHLDNSFKVIQPGDNETEVMWDVVPHWWYKELVRFKIMYEATETEYRAYIAQYEE